MQPGWVEFAVPARRDRGPLERRPSALRPHDRRRTNWACALSRAGPAGLLVRSAGQEAGDFGHIYLNGRDVSPNPRGYNLVALDSQRRLLERGQLRHERRPRGQPQDGRVVGRAGAGHGRGGRGARRGIGEPGPGSGRRAAPAWAWPTDLRGHFRWGHAFIAAVGAAPGWAPTVRSLGRGSPSPTFLRFPPERAPACGPGLRDSDRQINTVAFSR